MARVNNVLIITFIFKNYRFNIKYFMYKIDTTNKHNLYTINFLNHNLRITHDFILQNAKLQA